MDLASQEALKITGGITGAIYGGLTGGPGGVVEGAKKGYKGTQSFFNFITSGIKRRKPT
jgi:hypothetical protein